MCHHVVRAMGWQHSSEDIGRFRRAVRDGEVKANQNIDVIARAQRCDGQPSIAKGQRSLLRPREILWMT